MTKYRYSRLVSASRSCLILLLFFTFLKKDYISAETCASCGKEVDAKFYLRGHGTVTIGGQTKSVQSDKTVSYEFKYQVPTSGVIAYQLVADGSREDRKSVLGGISFTYGCTYCNVESQAGWCEPADGGCCQYGDSCYDPNCGGGSSCDDEPGDENITVGTKQILPNETEFFNPGNTSLPNAQNSGGNSSAVPDVVTSSISLGRLTQTHGSIGAGMPNGAISFAFSAVPQQGGGIAIPSKSGINIKPAQFPYDDPGFGLNFHEAPFQDRDYIELAPNLRQIISDESVINVYQLVGGQQGVLIKAFKKPGAIVPISESEEVIPDADALLSEIQVTTTERQFDGINWNGLQVTTTIPNEPPAVYELFSVPTGTEAGEWIEVNGDSAIKTIATNWVTVGTGENAVTTRQETVTDYKLNAVNNAFYAVGTRQYIYRKLQQSANNWIERRVESTVDVGNGPRTTFWFYEEDGDLPTFGNLIAQLNSDGSWIRNVYDNELNITENSDFNKLLKTTYSSWLDEGSAAIQAAQTPADKLAAILSIPVTQCRSEEISYLTAPDRTVRRSYIKGVLVSTTTETEFTVIDPYLGIRSREYRTLVQAPDGSILSDSRRGVKADDPTGVEGWETTIYSIETDGSRVTYEEEKTGTGDNYTNTQITTHGTVTQPAGIPGRTLREISISNFERTLSSQTQVFVGGQSYSTISSTTYQETEENGLRVERTFEDGVEVSTTRYLEVADVESGEVEQTDATGMTTISYTDPVTGTSTQTQVGGGAVEHNGQTLFSGVDLVTVTSRGPRLGSSPPEGYIEKTTVTANGVTRVQSETEYDGLGRARRMTDARGISRSMDYSLDDNGTEMMVETLPGNLTRITRYYVDGQIKSVTGTAVIAEFHDYALVAGGRIKHTQYVAVENSPRRMSSYSNAGGRQLRTEQPGPGGANDLIWTDYVYNNLGQLVRVNSSGKDAEGLSFASQVNEYDSLGQTYRSGKDYDGNGVLDEASADSITETYTSYEQSAGVWWRVLRSRVYDREEVNGFRQSMQRIRLGTGSSQVMESISPSGAKQVMNVTVDRANRTRTTQAQLPGSTFVGQRVEIGGLTFYSSSTATLGYTEVNSYSDFRELVKNARHGETSSYVYNAVGQLESESHATNNTPTYGVTRTTTYTYISATLANAGQVLSKNAPFSLLSTDTSTTYYEYDNLGRQTGQWGPGAYPVQYGFNLYGDRTSMTTYRTQDISSANAPWSQQVASPLVSTTTWEYHLTSGLMVSKKDADQQATWYAYHPGSTLQASRTWAREVSGQPLVTHFDYDRGGRLSAVSYSDASSPTVRYTYRRDGSPATVLDAAGLRTFSNWSKEGRPQSETIGEDNSSLNLLAGLQRRLPFDSLGRRTGYSGQWSASGVQLELPSSAWAYNATYGYWSDILSGTLQMNWLRKTNESFPKTTVTRNLTQGGLSPMISHTVQSSPRGVFSVSHAGSAFNQQRSRGNNGSPINNMTVHDSIFRVDPKFGVGVLSSDTSANLYTVDTRGQITSARTKFTNFAPGMDASYHYDDLGNRLDAGQGTAQQTDLSDLEPITYSSNTLNQYTSIARPDALDITGMAPTAQTVKVNGQTTTRSNDFFHHRVESDRSDDSLPAWMPIEVTADSTSTNPPLAAARTGHIYMPPIPEILAYDADGNLTSDSRWDYAWDAENRLVQMRARETAVTVGAPNLRLRFAYDYLSRRIQKTVEKEMGSYGSGTWELQSDTRFIYDGWNLISEVEMKGNAADAPNAGIVQGGNTVFRPYLRRSYVWGPDVSGTEAGAGGVGGLLAVTRHERQGKAAESYWACWDLNGNVIGLASTTVSERAAVYDYDAFGKTVRVNEPEAGLNPIRFSSKYTDEETGLVYYGYRYYSPEMGRWISRDPIGEKGGINLYGMVGNDPVNGVDMLGRSEYQPCVIKLYLGHGDIVDDKLAQYKKEFIAATNNAVPGSASWTDENYARASGLGCDFNGSNSYLGFDGYISPLGVNGKQQERTQLTALLEGTSYFGIGMNSESPFSKNWGPMWNGGYNPSPMIVNGKVNWDSYNQAAGFLKLVSENWVAALNFASKLASQGKANNKECCPEVKVILTPVGPDIHGIYDTAKNLLESGSYKNYVNPREITTYENLKKGTRMPRSLPSLGETVIFDRKL